MENKPKKTVIKEIKIERNEREKREREKIFVNYMNCKEFSRTTHSDKIQFVKILTCEWKTLFHCNMVRLNFFSYIKLCKILKVQKSCLTNEKIAN